MVKAFGKKVVLLIAPLVCMLVSINFIGDPGFIFKSRKYEQGIARFLHEGYNVANVLNFDERIMQLSYIESMDKGKDVIVLGSSRSEHIREKLFPKMDFFNHSVSGATIQDYIAVFEIYQQNNMKPNTVILTLDPWLLKKDNMQNRWQSIGSYYEAYESRSKARNKKYLEIFTKYSEVRIQIIKYMQLFSPSYFQSSIKHLSRVIKHKKFKSKYYPTHLEESEARMILKDGSASLPEEVRHRSVAEVQQQAMLYANARPVYSIGPVYNIDEELMRKCEKFVNYLSGKGVNIIFFIPPYHPYVYEFLINADNYKNIHKAETFFKSLAVDCNIKVVGSYNPDNCAFTGADFYDGMHLRPDAVGSLFTHRDLL